MRRSFSDVTRETSRNVGSVGRAEPVSPVSQSSNKAVALLPLLHFHSECLSCSLKVVNVDGGAGINKQHDGCILSRALQQSEFTGTKSALLNLKNELSTHTFSIHYGG